jgi:non-ribosomal peptide synthetase component F
MNLIRIFENAVKKFSDHIAIKGSGYAFTYSEFDALSHNFAQKLIEKGVKPNDIVGLCLERSAEMMVGIFGILKAGAAYLPVDATHPPKRISSILTDAAVKWVVTTSDLESFVSELGFIPVVPDCTVFQKQNKYELPVLKTPIHYLMAMLFYLNRPIHLMRPSGKFLGGY